MSAPAVLVSGVVLSQPAGGVRRHAQELLPRVATRLAERGGRLAVLTGSDGLPFELPADVECLPSEVPSGPPLRRVLPEGRALARAVAAAREAGSPFDLLHTGHLPVPRRMPLPYTLTQHDLRQLTLPGAPFTRRFLARNVIGSALRGAAGIVVVSETVREEIGERFAIEPGRISVVPNAADHLDPLPRAPGARAPILAVGHVEPRKNLGLLIEALALDPELPPLVLAGRSQAGEHERLAALAEARGVSGRVTFQGPFADEELAGLYAGAACVAVPSFVEGFGISALEAQRARVPLAVARAGALPEVAGPDVPLFPPDDPRACARALREAIDQPTSVLDARAEREQHFTWDTSADRWVAALVRATATHTR